LADGASSDPARCLPWPFALPPIRLSPSRSRARSVPLCRSRAYACAPARAPACAQGAVPRIVQLLHAGQPHQLQVTASRVVFNGFLFFQSLRLLPPAALSRASRAACSRLTRTLALPPSHPSRCLSHPYIPSHPAQSRPFRNPSAPALSSRLLSACRVARALSCVALPRAALSCVALRCVRVVSRRVARALPCAALSPVLRALLRCRVPSAIHPPRSPLRRCSTPAWRCPPVRCAV
jgi:hypothetical protein